MVGLTGRGRELCTGAMSLEATAYRCAGRKYSQIYLQDMASRYEAELEEFMAAAGISSTIKLWGSHSSTLRIKTARFKERRSR